MIDLLITGATIVTVNPQREILEEAALAVDKGRIVALGAKQDVETRYPMAARRIEARGRIIFPGLINTHNHLFQTLLKGLGDDRVLSSWFAQMTAPSAAHLTEDDVHTAALLGCLEGIHSGTTTMFDYMYPHPRPFLTDAIVRAMQDLGIRGVVGRGMMDTGEEFGVPRGIQQDVKTIVADAQRLLETYHRPGGRMRIWLAPAALWSNSRGLLSAVRELASSYHTGISIHVSETPFDRASTEKLHGLGEMDLLEGLSLLGPDLLMVHTVYLNDREIRMSRHYDVKISHNPVSNMYLSSGVAPIPKMLLAGLTVGLATDGAGSNNSQDMIEVLKFGALLQKVHHTDPTVITAEKLLEMATIDGARALGLEKEIGSLEVGKRADFFLFNPALTAKATPLHNPVSTLVYSAGEENVETVVVDGQIVMENRQVLTVDEPTHLQRAQKVAGDLARRAGTDRLANRPWRSLAY